MCPRFRSAYCLSCHCQSLSDFSPEAEGKEQHGRQQPEDRPQTDDFQIDKNRGAFEEAPFRAEPITQNVQSLRSSKICTAIGQASSSDSLLAIAPIRSIERANQNDERAHLGSQFFHRQTTTNQGNADRAHCSYNMKP
jgi:hypothetical protein